MLLNKRPPISYFFHKVRVELRYVSITTLLVYLLTSRFEHLIPEIPFFHLLFNIISIALGLLVFPLFVRLIEQISGKASIEQKIANANMIFNTAGVLLFIPLVHLLEKLLNRWLPTKEKEPEVVTA